MNMRSLCLIQHLTFKGAAMKYTQGTKGTYSGFRAVFVRHYHGNMIEIRVPGGLICVDMSEFIAEGKK